MRAVRVTRDVQAAETPHLAPAATAPAGRGVEPSSRAAGFFWYPYQDGTIQLEVKPTGVLSLGAVRPGEEPK